MLEFFEGTLDGSDLITDQTKMKSCTTMIKEDFFRESLSMARKGLNIDVFGILYSFYHMVWHLDPLFYDCKESPNDIIEVLIARFDDVYDAKVVMMNVILNYAMIVDTIEDL